MKNNKKKGFTLMELLIVIAIIVVLVAIAIPVFSGQLTKAKETTDVANLRACYAEQQSAILADDKTPSDAAAAMMEVSISDSSKRERNGNKVTYTASKIKNGSSSTFEWDFSAASIS